MDQNTRRTVSICFQVDYAPVGAGAVRSGVGTLASPMGAGEQDAGRPKGPHPSSLPPPPLRDEPAFLLVSQNNYP